MYLFIYVCMHVCVRARVWACVGLCTQVHGLADIDIVYDVPNHDVTREERRRLAEQLKNAPPSSR